MRRVDLMKVLQVLPELDAGGVERGTLEVARHLVARGHESLVISHGGQMVEKLVTQGSRHIALPVHRKSLMSLRLVGEMRDLLERERPDILHYRSRVPGWICWLAWRGMDRATRPKLVTTVHGFYSVNFYSAIMTRGQRVIAVSESVREYICEHYRKVDPNMIRVIHRGVDTGLYHPGYRPDAAWVARWESAHPELRDRVVLLMPGRLTRWKGQEDFLQVVRHLRDAGVSVHGVIAGGAHEKKREFGDELERMIEELDLRDRVTMLGHRGDMREVMAVSDLVFSLSRDPEAFGRVSLEAMALGKPVVGYAHGGVGEQLAAIFPQGAVESKNVEQAAQTARWILDDQLKPGGVDNFSLAKMVAAIEAVYDEVLEGEGKVS